VKRINLAALAVGLVAISLGIAACGSDDGDDAPGQARFELVIGDSLPLSGELGSFGRPGGKASDIALDEIKRAIADTDTDQTVKLVHKDNGSNPQAARAVARELIEDDGASCLVGPWGAPDSSETFESESSKNGVLQITPTSVADELAEIDDPDGLLNFASLPSAPQGAALADYIEQELGGADGVVVNLGARNDAYGTATADAFRSAWEDKGGTVGKHVIYQPNQPSYKREAGQIADGRPEAFVIVDFPDTYAQLGPTLAGEQNWSPQKTFVTDALISTVLPQRVGEEATEGIRGTAPGAPDKGEASTEFDELYTESEPKDVERQVFDAQTFDATILCYLSAVAAGSANGEEMAAEIRDITAPPGDGYTWVELPAAVEALQKGDDIDYVGASGEIDMDETGTPTAGVYDIYRYRGGELELFDEVPVDGVEIG
jgi:ABC-type branched-subunit amino acid transport system substrate-binding protein